MADTILDYIYNAILGICALLALFRFKSVNKAFRFLCLYILYGLTTEILWYYSSIILGNNYFLSNLYSYVTLFLLACFFYLNHKSPNGKKVIITVFVLLFSLLALNIFAFPTFRNAHQYNVKLISGFLIIILSLCSIYRQVLRDSNAAIYRYSVFWVAALFVLYKFIDLWSRAAYYYPFREHTETVWGYFHSTIMGNNIVLYAGLCIVLWLYPKMKQ